MLELLRHLLSPSSDLFKERKSVSFNDRDMFEGDGGMVVENTRDARAAVDSVPL